MVSKLSRKHRKLLLALLLALVIAFGGANYLSSGNLTEYMGQHQPGLYEVVGVEDGDTITVEAAGRRERVRLIGIDTPELHHPERPVQCFAEAAKAFTASLIDSQAVRLQADPLDDNRDLYQRLLRYVYLPDGTLVNTAVVAEGYGFAYTRFPFTKLAEMQQLESRARQAGRGLWRQCTISEINGTKETNGL